MPNLLLAESVIAEAIFLVLVFLIGDGTGSIPYPAPLKALEVVAVVATAAIVVALLLLVLRSVWMPVVALIGAAGGIPVAFHDEAVPEQRGHAEIEVLTIFVGVTETSFRVHAGERVAELICGASMVRLTASSGMPTCDGSLWIRPGESWTRSRGTEVVTSLPRAGRSRCSHG